MGELGKQKTTIQCISTNTFISSNHMNPMEVRETTASEAAACSKAALFTCSCFPPLSLYEVHMVSTNTFTYAPGYIFANLNKQKLSEIKHMFCFSRSAVFVCSAKLFL